MCIYIYIYVCTKCIWRKTEVSGTCGCVYEALSYSVLRP